MNIEFNKAFGQNIRRLRKYNNLTQEQLSARLQVNGLDITRVSIAKIETGRRHISPYEIKCISEILNIDVKEFFYFNESDNNDLVENID